MGELASGTTSIPDDEFVLRRIPPGEPWVRAELELTTANFKPRRHLGETGISVSRERLTSASELLARIPVEVRDRLGRGDLWRVARASVREIRNLGLDVVADPTPEDPGHAQIVDAAASMSARRVRHALTALFSIQHREIG